MSRKKFIYGGEHSLNLCIKSNKENEAYNILEKLNKNTLFFRSGRDAFNSIIDFLKPNIIWLPNYICDSLWEISRRKTKINWYEVRNDLEINTEQIIKGSSPNDVVFIIATFGSKSIKNLEFISKSIKSKIIVDLTHLVLDHNLINKVKEYSHYQIFSLRKAFPVLDGGLLSSSLPLNIQTIQGAEYDSYLAYRSIGLLSRGAAIRRGIDENENIKYLKKAEEILNKEENLGINISPFSRNILKLIDYKKCSEKSRSNRFLIYKLIYNCKCFKLLSQDDSISIYIPMLFESQIKRDIFRKKLRDKSIYFPVHWPLPLDSEITKKKKEHLSNRMLSIPCDYRYSKSDIKNICKVLKRIDIEINI